MIRKTILLIDDDAALRHALAEQLEEDFATAESGTGAEAMERLRQERFDLLLLDVGLPDMDGRDLCQQIRDAGIRTPIIMLTGVDSEDDAVRGLESGANDYVTKPFRIGELTARIRAHLREHEQSDDATFVIGPYAFRPGAKMLLHAQGNRKVRLTEKETAILKFLYRAGAKVVGRDVLLHEVWGYNAGVTTHTVETHVYRLRQKIEPDPANARILVTEPGGYRLAAEPAPAAG